MNNTAYSFYPKPYNILYKEINFEMPIHMHNELELVLCVNGIDSVLANHSVYHADKHTLLFFPSNCTHRIVTEHNAIYKRYVLTISPTWLKNILGRDNKLTIINNLIPRVIILNNDEYMHLKNIFDIYLSNKNNELKRLSILFKILELCDEILKNETHFDSSPINEIIQYINANLAANLKINDIANMFFLNPDYLCRLFKKHTNMTIVAYINMQRVSLARELLDCGETIQETQNAAGFNSYSHFCRVFKKLIHNTPKQYQNRTYYFDTIN